MVRVGASSRRVNGGGRIVGLVVGLNEEWDIVVVGEMLALGIMRMKWEKDCRILYYVYG